MCETTYENADAILAAIKRDFGDIVPVGTGPAFHDEVFIEMSVGCEFERFSHENWDLVHRVRLPLMRAMWKSTTGWRFCNEGAGCPEFYGPSLLMALAAALAFLQEAAPIIREAKETL